MTFRQIGGMRFGLLSLTWPFAVLTVKADQLSLNGYKLRRTTIKRLSIYKFVHSKGLRIEHDIRWLPKLIVFWPLDMSALLSELKTQGYDVVLSRD